MKTKNCRAVALILGLTVAAFAVSPALAAAQKTIPKSESWKLKDTKEKLSLSENHLMIVPPDGPLDVIPFDGIIAIFHDNRPYRPVAEEMEASPKSFLDAEGQSGGDLIALPAWFVANEVLLAPFAWIKTHRHYVFIVWKDEGRVRSRSFRLDKAGAESLLAALSDATGRSWVDLDFGERLKRGDFGYLRIHLPSDATVGEKALVAGDYPLAVMETGDGLALVCFFTNYDFRPENLLVVVGARVAPLNTEEVSRGVLASDELGYFRLSEIRLKSKVYRILSTRDFKGGGAIPAVKP